MRNQYQEGRVIDCTAPSGGVVSGTGYKIGTHLFGVAGVSAAEGETFALQIEGVVELPKTSALEISPGDIVYWVAGSSVVNKTATSNKAVGIAVSTAANPSATVLVKLLPNVTAIA